MRTGRKDRIQICNSQRSVDTVWMFSIIAHLPADIDQADDIEKEEV